MFKDTLIISLTVSAVILILLALSPILNRRYSAKWRYIIWLLLALRLLIPYRVEISHTPISIPVTEQVVVLRDEGSALQVMTPKEAEQGGIMNPNPADYAPIADVNDIINTIWILGIVVFMTYHICCYAIFRKKIKPHLVYIGKSIYSCNKIDTPMMIGFFSPLILLPDTDYTDKETEIIIGHEMAHFRRGDLWYKLLMLTANAVHWFNPFVYIMVRKANRDLEYFCDDSVTKDTDKDYKKFYSLTILKTMKKRGEQNEK